MATDRATAAFAIPGMIRLRENRNSMTAQPEKRTVPEPLCVAARQPDSSGQFVRC
jgi:hypothetical protein